MNEVLLGHTEIMETIDTVDPQIVTVIDPAGWIIFGIIMLLSLVIIYQYEKIKNCKQKIEDMDCLLSYYCYEDQIK